MGTVIIVETLSKQYKIGHAVRDTMLRERLGSFLTLDFLRKKSNDDTIWALQNVSFSIERGETVGIIGRNGAGKSTLLKILSRITYPTSGDVKVDGRLAALLEVGTGFHPELTGRENIYLNGSILGMSRKEVARKMGAIIEFSGVERFLDTPIKRYSSGMRLRLGFAVAAHLEPDILIVDEVLAVGDAAFQKKCLNSMEDLRANERTVLFVSHNLAAVEHLCRRCIWIDAGKIRMDGDSRPVIHAYMENALEDKGDNCSLNNTDSRRGTGQIWYRGVEFVSAEGYKQKIIRAGDPVVLRFHYSAREAVPSASFGFRMYTDLGTLVTETSTWHHGISVPASAGDGYLDLEIGCLNLMPAKYSLSLWITDMEGKLIYDNVENAITMEVEPANIYKSGKLLDSRAGLVFFPQKWDLSGVTGQDLVV
jgi:lipopolysaccharide transport system ATP-binding protein